MAGSNTNVKQLFFLALTSVLVVGYVMQVSIIRDLTEGQHHNNNNNNMIVMMPIVQQQQQGDENNRQLSGDMLRQAQQQRKQPPKRSRLKEKDVLPQLTNAMKPAENLIQPPLGAGTSKEDPSLSPIEKSYRGTDLTVAENQSIRENRLIYLITPTYKRRTQMVDLTRLSQTLRLARESGYHQRLYWIILEDADTASSRVRQIALDSGIPFAHQAVKTSLAVRRNPRAHRGLEQRNMGLDIVEQVGAEGVVYFMDDDNAYHVQLMHELSYTTHVSVFGVGLPGGSAYERW